MSEAPTDNPNARSVELQRTEQGHYQATNPRGGSISLGRGADEDFTPVELLLVAIAGCSAVDVDFITSKKVDPLSFTVTGTGTKVSDDDGNRMADLAVSFDLAFPDTEEGRAAAERIPRAIEMSHGRLCSVSRTVALGTEVTMTRA
ncbi:MAG: OsmC family protein [Propionibacteriaceae bacterium]